MHQDQGLATTLSSETLEQRRSFRWVCLVLAAISLMLCAPSPHAEISANPTSFPADYRSPPLSISLGGIQAEFTIRADRQMVFPMLNGLEMDKFVSTIVPIGDRSAREYLRTLQVGHIAPYVYNAVSSFLVKILMSPAYRIAWPRDMSENVDGTFVASDFQVHVFFDDSAFRKESSKLGHQTSVAYFDPNARVIGLRVEQELLRWIGFQTRWEDVNAAAYVLDAVEYFRYLFLKRAAHELFHLFQTQSNTDDILIPAVYEGQATYIQFVTAGQTEIEWLASEEMQRAEQPIWRGPSICSDAERKSFFFDYAGILALKSAHRHFFEGDGSLARLLSLDRDGFYVGASEVGYSTYDLAATIPLFFAQLDEAGLLVWDKVVAEVVESGSAHLDSPHSRMLDDEFKEWLGAFMQRLTGGSSRTISSEQMEALIPVCLSQTQYVSALLASRAFALAANREVQAAYKMGDVFYRAQASLPALYHYRHALGDKHIHETTVDKLLKERVMEMNRLAEVYDVVDRVRLWERLGNVLELMGRIDDALIYFKKANEVRVMLPDAAVFQARSQLKVSLYEQVFQRIDWRSFRTVNEVNETVKRFMRRYSAMAAAMMEDRVLSESTILELSRLAHRIAEEEVMLKTGVRN